MATAEELRKQFGIPKIVDAFTPFTELMRQTFNAPKPSASTPLTDELRRIMNVPGPKLSPFLEDVKEMTTEKVHELAAAGDKAATKQTKIVADWFKGKLQVSPADWAEGVKETAVGSVHLAGKLAQELNAGIFRIGKSAAKSAGMKVTEPEVVGSDLDQTRAQTMFETLTREGRHPAIKERQVGDSYVYDVVATPKQGTIGRILTELEGDITGYKGGVSTYQSVFRDVEKWASENKATPIEAKNFAGFAVLGLLFADSPFGAPGKTGVHLSKEAIEELAKANADDAVEEILRRENPDMPDDIVDFLTPSMRAADTPQEVTAVLRLTNKAAAQAAPTVIEESATVNPKTIGKELSTAERAVSKISDDLKELVVEARKFKSSGEFIEDMTRTRYSRLISDRELEAFNKTGQLPPSTTGFTRLINPGEIGKIKSVGPSKRHLVTFTDDIEKLRDDPLRTGGGNETQTQIRGPINAPFIERIIENPKRIYEEATKAPAAPKQAIAAKITAPSDYKPSTNLIRNVAEISDEYEMLKLMEREFPKLPEKVRDKLVSKLVRLRRATDIEGYLKTADRMSREPSTLSPKQKKILDDTLPKSVSEVMDDSEKVRYIQNISRKIDDEETAVLAANEYNRIMEAADQGVINRYNELTFQKSMLEDVISQDHAAQLWTRYYRYYKDRNPNDPTVSLEDIMQRAQKKVRENRHFTEGKSKLKKERKLTPNEELAWRLDTEIEYLGYGTFDEAQEAVNRYAQMRSQVKEIEQELREMKPIFQGATLLRGLVDEIPVISTKSTAVIDEVANTADIRSTYQDIAGLNAGFRDVYRNFRRFFGSRYDDIKKAVLDPFDRAKGSYADEIIRQGDALEDEIVERFGIKRGSKDSARVQIYGEAPDTATAGKKGDARTKAQIEEELVAELGRARAAEIMEASVWFRKKYNDFIDELNSVRSKMYPSNPEKLIAYRQDYFRHFQELGDDFRSAVANFFDTPSGIKPELVGISEQTKPKSKFLAFAEERKGIETEVDAVGGFVDYVPMFAYAKHIDPHISAFRYLRRKLAEKAPTRGQELPLLDDLTGQPLPGGERFKHRGIDNFLGFLDDFANDLAGKTNPLDRFVQKRIPGGRATMRLIDLINNRIKANQILGNLGVVVAQVASVPLTISRTGRHSVTGMKRTLATLMAGASGKDIGPISQSTFLKERYLQSLKDRFPVEFSNKPVTATIDTGRKTLAWMLRVSDHVAAMFAWHSNYAKYMAEHSRMTGGSEILDETFSAEAAIKYADDESREILGGRGIGEVPLDQKSRLFQIVAPFQLEVGNFWHAMDDRTREYYKGAGNREWQAIVTVLLANYMFNEASEQIRGSRVVYDPVNALIEGSIDLVEETKTGDPVTGGVKLLGRQVGEFLSNLPVGQTIAATLVPEQVRQELFGNQNPTRFGEVPLAVQTVQRVGEGAYNLLTGTGDPGSSFTKALMNSLAIILPYGSRQLEKSFKGLEGMITGTVETVAGDLSYVVKPTIENWVRASLFGAAATSEARQYFEERSDLFQRVERQDKQRNQQQLTAEADWAELKRIRAKDGDATANELWKEMSAKDRTLASRIADIKKDEEAGLDGNDRLVKMLGVENGERAKYIAGQMQKMKTTEEKNEYYKYLAERNLISKKVFAQLKYLLAQTP